MRKAFGLVLAGLGAVMLTRAAAAASQDRHTMTVPLPDGSTARIEYVGKVAPTVSITPAPMSIGFPAFGMFDSSVFDIQRHIDAMMKQMNEVASRSAVGGPAMNVAAYGSAPAGSSSVTIVSTSNGSKTCTRRTEVTSQGPGKAPKVLSSMSGDCGPATAANPRNPT